MCTIYYDVAYAVYLIRVYIYCIYKYHILYIRDVIVQYIILPARINAEKIRTDLQRYEWKNTREYIMYRHLSACCNDY